jgi:hypothetical protein
VRTESKRVWSSERDSPPDLAGGKARLVTPPDADVLASSIASPASSLARRKSPRQKLAAPEPVLRSPTRCGIRPEKKKTGEGLSDRKSTPSFLLDEEEPVGPYNSCGPHGLNSRGARIDGVKWD